MSKLASAADFNALVDSGKYESKTNAQRAAGRTRLSEAEKKKAFAYIESYFGPDGSPPPGKKPSKKVAAKKAAPAAAPARKAKKKAAAKKKAWARGEKAPPGTLPLSPSQVETAGDMLSLIDSTVNKGESIILALKKANDISADGDIAEGVRYVKESLTKAAQLLNQAVVLPLQQTAAAHGDSETAMRLQQAVQASNAVDNAVHFQPPAPPTPPAA